MKDGIPNNIKYYQQNKLFSSNLFDSLNGWMPSCSAPVTSLVFLKNHKCASTTVERIFLRYGKKHGLSFVLPNRGNRIGLPLRFNETMISQRTKSKDNKYDFYVLHSRLFIPSIENVTRDNAIWVTIIRDPFTQFESLWIYYDLAKFFNMTLQDYVRLPYKKLANMRKDGIWGIHQMMFDLGHGDFVNHTDDNIMSYIHRIDHQFDLVMLAEKIDESLILLKHLMCWTTEDVAYIKINFRNETSDSIISDTIKSSLKNLNKPDILLYTFFKERFDYKVREFGESLMESEVELLRNVSENLKAKCIIKPVYAKSINGFQTENSHIFSYKIKVNSSECYDLIRYQPEFINEFRERQADWTSSNYTIDMKLWKRKIKL